MQVKSGNCSEVVETCDDTCQKLLSCGKHSCAQRCHRGACNQVGGNSSQTN